MKHWLPNALTAARIALTPPVGYFLARGEARAALPLLAVAALTDAADGWLARRLGAITATGAYLDPIADKLLAATVFVGLAAGGRLPWWLAALVLGRDVLILLFAAWALRFTRLRRFPPSVWGKASTIIQFSLGVACVLDMAMPEAGLGAASNALVPLAAVATAWSGLHYGWTAVRQLRQMAD
ncbi:MAG: CDP-alcohol phosphatidyltransferase family protein [Bryobacteraceae bacterium]|nr:CDP-alcohol phosphatidyltransferase family protein [Bryobacteraceae bacterium]